jgi:hypothetical protein
MRTFQGNKAHIPDGMTPVEWANAVWTVMDEDQVTEREARGIVLNENEMEITRKPSRDHVMTGQDEVMAHRTQDRAGVCTVCGSRACLLLSPDACRHTRSARKVIGFPSEDKQVVFPQVAKARGGRKR